MTIELTAPPYTRAVPLPARVVAAVLRERLPGVGVKKLHKLLYYCQGHHLATFGRPLFDETVSAWDMGPVVGSLWFAERQGLTPPEPPSVQLGEAELNTVGYVLSRYGRLSGRDLEVLSHGEDPWLQPDRHRRPGGAPGLSRTGCAPSSRRRMTTTRSRSTVPSCQPGSPVP